MLAKFKDLLSSKVKFEGVFLVSSMNMFNNFWGNKKPNISET